MLFRRPPEERDGIIHAAKRKQVAKFLQTRNQFDGLAPIFGNVIAVQFLHLASRGQEMAVVHQRVFDARFGQCCGQLRFPNTLRKPCPTGTLAKLLFDEVCKTPDLLDLIFKGNRNQNWFVEASAHDLDLALGRKRRNLLNVFGVMFGNPFEQRTGIMQPEPDARMPRDALQKWQIGPLVGSLHHIVEVPDRLVRVDEQD